MFSPELIHKLALRWDQIFEDVFKVMTFKYDLGLGFYQSHVFVNEISVSFVVSKIHDGSDHTLGCYLSNETQKNTTDHMFLHAKDFHNWRWVIFAEMLEQITMTYSDGQEDISGVLVHLGKVG